LILKISSLSKAHLKRVKTILMEIDLWKSCLPDRQQMTSKENNVHNNASTSVTTNHAQSHSLRSFVVEKATRNYWWCLYTLKILFPSSVVSSTNPIWWNIIQKSKHIFLLCALGVRKGRKFVFVLVSVVTANLNGKRNPSEQRDKFPLHLIWYQCFMGGWFRCTLSFYEFDYHYLIWFDGNKSDERFKSYQIKKILSLISCQT
jgi:hypothetical protein